jgi:hypothetical protein
MAAHETSSLLAAESISARTSGATWTVNRSSLAMRRTLQQYAAAARRRAGLPALCPRSLLFLIPCYGIVGMGAEEAPDLALVLLIIVLVWARLRRE